MKMVLAMAPTIVLMVYGQLITKWRVQLLAETADGAQGGVARLMNYLADPYIISAYLTTFAASLAWMFVVERYAISAVFPVYIGLTVLMVAAGGAVLFGEPVTGWRIASIVLIVAGVAVGSRA